MSTYNWQDYFNCKPCEDGWEYGLPILEKYNGDLGKALLDVQDKGYYAWAISHAINLNVDTLNQLASDSDEDVRRAVASNANTHVSTISKLAGDRDEYVRWVVALHPKMQNS